MSRRLLPNDAMVDELDLPFWRACAEGRFLVHRCDTCGRAYWPATCCVDHGGSAMQWVDASGRGVVHTFTVFHHAYDASFAAKLPYVIAVITLDEGPFFHTDLVGCDPDDVHVGMAVEVVYEQIDDEWTMPHFRPRTDR
jgi:uncharacterized OB-fold protein